MAWHDGVDKDSPAYRFATEDSYNIRVLAGPGTGKSFGLRRRVARLLENGVNPKKILAVTFTRTAALDLRSEISQVNVEGADKVVARTLHSLCLQILQSHHVIAKTGRNPRPLIQHEITPMLYDLSGKYGNVRQKKRRLSAFEAAWARLQSEEPGFPNDETDRQFNYDVQRWLKAHKAMLFGEMIIEAYHYLTDNPCCRERSKFDHILVDEYQDLNKAEQAVIDLLATNSALAIIGDDDQSIYSFKFAHPEGIRQFVNCHEKCSEIEFAECRRCPQKVVSMASRLISHNRNRTLGQLIPFSSNQEGNVKIVQWSSLKAEIIGLSNHIKRKIDSNEVLPEDILVLTPAKIIGYQLRDTLIELGVNAKSYFREDALRSNDAKYLYSLLNFTANPNDLVALRYLLGFGSQNFRMSAYAKVLDCAELEHLTVKEVLDSVLSGRLELKGAPSIISRYRELCEEVSRIRESISSDRNSIIDTVFPDNMDCSELRSLIRLALENEEINEIEDTNEWLLKIHTFVLEKVAYPEDIENQDHVRIMSLHASKGLSAKYVIVTSCIDELVPGAHENDEYSLEEQVEEQRRLFYVAITRCKSTPAYPGSLVISSFTGLDGSEALKLGIQASAYQWTTTQATRFIRDFEGTAPKTIII